MQKKNQLGLIYCVQTTFKTLLPLRFPSIKTALFSATNKFLLVCFLLKITLNFNRKKKIPSVYMMDYFFFHLPQYYLLEEKFFQFPSFLLPSHHMLDYFCYTKFTQSLSGYTNDHITLISVYTLFGALLFT